MQSDATLTSYFFKLWPWIEANLKRIAWVAGIAGILAVAISYYVWQQNQKEANAGMALTRAAMIPPAAGGVSDAIAKVADDYPGTQAAARALLQSGSQLFLAGKYPEASAQFQRFLNSFPDNPLAPQASLGVATCLDAQGKTDDAIKAYKAVIGQSSDDNSFAQAKFSLGRIYDSQKKYTEAQELYRDVARAYPYSTLGQEAMIRAEELKLPVPVAQPVVSVPPRNFSLTSTNLSK